MKFIKEMIIKKREPEEGPVPQMSIEALQRDLENSGFDHPLRHRQESVAEDEDEQLPGADDDWADEDWSLDDDDDLLETDAAIPAAAELEADDEAFEDTALDEEAEEALDDSWADDDLEELDVMEEDDLDDTALSDDWSDEFEDDEDADEDEMAEKAMAEKRALVEEIREAMSAVSHIRAEEKPAHGDSLERFRKDRMRGSWAEDDVFGRKAIAREKLGKFADDAEGDRLLEATNTKLGADDEGGRRRLAMAHLKAAAAATKADSVLKRSVGRDPATDPEEQVQYRDDLAKVVRPQSPSLAAGEDDDFGASEPARPSARVFTREVNDYRDTARTARPVAAAMDDDEDEDDVPVLSARKIWEMDQADTATSAPRAAAPEVVQVPTSIPGRQERRGAGRVKTRLLGFQSAHAQEEDVFEASRDAGGPTGLFPVGWILVVKGEGRGSCFTLYNGVSAIGRGEDQTVRLNFGDSSISRNNHAAIAFDDEQNKFYLGHGGKSNIVRLNGRPVLSTEELSQGDLIRIGETTLKFIALAGDDFSWNDDGQGDKDNAAIA